LPYYRRRNEIEINRKKNKNSLYCNLKHFKSFISNRHNDSTYINDWENISKNNKIINIYGHCNVEKLEIRNNSIGIDTGCIYGGKLTALKLSSIFFFK
jgi:CRISPR/Cas system CSM-associated protein Csm4 (group 5 of RAMP superfamily)